MALARPPASLGGGVICVRVAQVRPATPSRTVSQRIHTSQKTPNAMATSDSESATWLTRLRRAYMRSRSRLRSAAEPGPCAGARAHAFAPSLFLSCASSILDSASTTKVMKNSTRPR